MKVILTWLILGVLLVNCSETQAAQESFETYKKITYRDFVDYINSLKNSIHFNSLFRITNAYEQFNIPDVPSCKSDPTKRCRSPLIEVSNFENGEEYVKKLPTTFLVAGFHGDETVGTHSLFYLLQYIEKNYQTDRDLYSLLQKSRLLILPMANANGFEGLKREETVKTGRTSTSELDPNRDFSYDLTRKGRCFQTTTARIIDSIFRSNLIVSCITFHGGDNSISYPWGNFAHSKYPYTADNSAFDHVAKTLSLIASGNPDLDIKEYNYGTMQRVVYDVHGGFEDWAYGASFDVNNVSRSCAGNSKLSYTQPYSRNSNRAFIFLVEAGYEKNPSEASLGNELGLFDRRNELSVWGHVARNIKMSFALAEMASPQIIVDGIAFGSFLDIDIRVKGCTTLDAIQIPKYGYQTYQAEPSPRNNQIKAMISIKPTEMVYPELKIKVFCDSKWKPEKARAESHFVRMRTDPDYVAENAGYFVASSSSIEATILNIDLAQIKMSYLSLAHDNVYTVVYNSIMQAEWETNRLKLAFEDGHLSLSFDHEDEQTSNVGVRIKRYGLRETDDASAYNTMIDVRVADKVPMSMFFFQSLQGRGLELYDLTTRTIYQTTHITALNNDPNDATVLPPSGLSCGSDLKSDNYFKVEVTYNKKAAIVIDLFTNVETDYQFSVGHLNGKLDQFISFDNSKALSAINYTTMIKITNGDDLRLVGQNIELLDDNEKPIFSCRLTKKDPKWDPAESTLNYFKDKEYKRIVEDHRSDTTDWRLYLIMLAVFAIAGILVFVIRRTGGRDAMGIHDDNPKQTVMMDTAIPNDQVNADP